MFAPVVMQAVCMYTSHIKHMDVVRVHVVCVHAVRVQFASLASRTCTNHRIPVNPTCSLPSANRNQFFFVMSKTYVLSWSGHRIVASVFSNKKDRKTKNWGQFSKNFKSTIKD